MEVKVADDRSLHTVFLKTTLEEVSSTKKLTVCHTRDLNSAIQKEALYKNIYRILYIAVTYSHVREYLQLGSKFPSFQS